MLSSGQQKLLSYFENAVKTDGVRHAYLLKGAHGSGKKYISRMAELYFACQNGTACKQCNGCKSAMAGANFDIIRLSPNEKKRYEVQTVRQLIKKVYEKPLGGKYKLVVIEDAHLMESVCQNALLKIIEEPPSYAVFLLLCDNISSILPTILSRVTPLELLPWSKNELRDFMPLGEEDEFLYSYCMGNPGVLLSLYEDEEFRGVRDLAIDRLCDVVKGLSPTAVFDAASALCSNKEHLAVSLETMTVFMRDVLFWKNGMKSQIVNVDKMSLINAASQKLTAKACLEITAICGNMPARMRFNENASMQIQGMFADIEKEIAKSH